MNPNSDQNQCPTCNRHFNAIEDFDAHRVGEFATETSKSTRRCMTADEIEKSFRTRDDILRVK